MRTSLSVCFLSIIVAACGNDAVPAVSPTVPLRIEARRYDGKYALFLNDATSPVSDDDFGAAIREYAQLIEPAAGLRGPDIYYGQSQNPVVFHAPEDCPGEVFLPVLEWLVQANTTKLWLELRRSGRAPLQCAIELPRDESLGPRRDYMLIFEPTKDESGMAWSVRGEALREGLPLAVARSVPIQHGDIAGSYEARFSALLVAAGEVTKDLIYNDAGVVWRADAALPDWGQLYLVFSVIAALNDARRKEQRSLINAWTRQRSPEDFTEPQAEPLGLPPINDD